MTFSWYFFGAASSLSMLWPSQFIFHFYCLSPVGKKIRHQWIITLIMTPFDGASSLCHFFSSIFDDAQSSGQFHFHFSDHKSNVVHNLYWFYDLAQMQHHEIQCTVIFRCKHGVKLKILLKSKTVPRSNVPKSKNYCTRIL